MAQWKCDDATARQMLGMPALENIDDLMGEAANDADTVTTTPASQPSPETGPSDAPVVALPKVGPAYRFSVLRAAGNAKSYRMVDGALVNSRRRPLPSTGTRPSRSRTSRACSIWYPSSSRAT